MMITFSINGALKLWFPRRTVTDKMLRLVLCLTPSYRSGHRSLEKHSHMSICLHRTQQFTNGAMQWSPRPRKQQLYQEKKLSFMKCDKQHIFYKQFSIKFVLDFVLSSALNHYGIFEVLFRKVIWKARLILINYI